MYKIPRKVFIELLTAKLELMALNTGGVKNWIEYKDSRETALDVFAESYNLERENLTFKDVAKRIIKNHT